MYEATLPFPLPFFYLAWLFSSLPNFSLDLGYYLLVLQNTSQILASRILCSLPQERKKVKRNQRIPTLTNHHKPSWAQVNAEI